jgi:hypothetical protein
MKPPTLPKFKDRPYEAAQMSFGEYNEPFFFREMLDAHFCTGTVISTPDVFLAFRPVEVDWTTDELCDPWKTSENPNAYHVFLAAGDLSKIGPHLPPALPFITFHRDGADKIHKLPYWQFLRALTYKLPLLGNRRGKEVSAN